MLRVHVVIGALMPSNFFLPWRPCGFTSQLWRGAEPSNYPGQPITQGSADPKENVWLNVTGVVRWGTGNRHEVSVEKYLKYKGCTTIL